MIDDEFKLTITRTWDSEEGDELMGELCEEIMEHYGGVIEGLRWRAEPRAQGGFGHDEMGNELVKYHPPRYTVDVRVGDPEPPQYPLDPKEWLYLLVHDINTSLPGFEAVYKRLIPLEGLRRSELANYLGETHEAEVLTETELQRRREDEDDESASEQ